MARDDFALNVKNALKDRVGGHCSNPACGKVTTGPNSNLEKSFTIGEAAHICAASPDGPRYNPEMTNDERKSVSNGIWLCSNCHTLIDSDPDRYPVALLNFWKADAEYKQFRRLNETGDTNHNLGISEKQRALQEIKEQFDLLHERLLYAYTLWECNLSRFFNANDMQNEIDDHWDLYKDNLQKIYIYQQYRDELNMLQKRYSLLVGIEISNYIENYLSRIIFHFESDSLGLYNNYWSSFFVMIEESYEELLSIKEDFDGACITAYQG